MKITKKFSEIQEGNIKSWDAGIQYAAEIACEFMWHFMLEDIGSNDKDAEAAAISIYRRITGKDIDIKEFLGL